MMDGNSRANVLLIDESIASKSTLNHIELQYRLNCSVNLIGVFLGKGKSKTGTDKLNCKTETELLEMISNKTGYRALQSLISRWACENG